MEFDPFTGFKLHPIPHEVSHLARGQWRKVFATSPDTARYVGRIERLESDERRAALSEDELGELNYARHRVALSWLVGTGRTQSMVGREPAEVAKVGYSGFWYRRGFHDRTHFVYWPWRRPDLLTRLLREGPLPPRD